MAYQLVQEVLDHAPPMTAAERLILVAIAEEIRSTTNRRCEIDTESLCRRTGGLARLMTTPVADTYTAALERA